MANNIRYIRDYNRAHYVRVSLDVKPETREKWKAAAEKRGESITAFISRAVDIRIEEEKYYG